MTKPEPEPINLGDKFSVPQPFPYNQRLTISGPLAPVMIVEENCRYLGLMNVASGAMSWSTMLTPSCTDKDSQYYGTKTSYWGYQGGVRCVKDELESQLKYGRGPRSLVIRLKVMPEVKHWNLLRVCPPNVLPSLLHTFVKESRMPTAITST